jgi:hypothetical protein
MKPASGDSEFAEVAVIYATILGSSTSKLTIRSHWENLLTRRQRITVVAHLRPASHPQIVP